MCRRTLSAPVLYFICFLCFPNPAAYAQDGSYRRELRTWRDDYVARLTKPDGWLSLAGLKWLEPGDNSFGSAGDNQVHVPGNGPSSQLARELAHLGVLRVEGRVVTLNPPAHGFPRDFLVDGKPAHAQELPYDSDRGDKRNPRMTIGSLQMYVVRRGDRFALRIKDAHSAALEAFTGLHWFQPNGRYRVAAKWIPYVPHKTVTLTSLVGTTSDADVPGAAEFETSGKTYRLEPVLEDPNEPTLFFILRDTTSSATTYPACRFLYTEFPSNGIDKPGELVLDFNHLENPPCAYTPYATCPLPPPGNRLPIALPVGEKRYHD
jgi:uncharacterized protein (DUF1684 family)